MHKFSQERETWVHRITALELPRGRSLADVCYKPISPTELQSKNNLIHLSLIILYAAQHMEYFQQMCEK